ncbi:hypothetical protein G9A89_021832 [Geosiphon pyriformis]|nr:hypothetical protein G9A89_021832 [Geosiphon pyriformis]
MIRKGFKLKAGLSWDFPNEVLYHFSLYDLKTFKQIQAKIKSASVINFSNAFGVVGQLFGHWFLDLQVLNWASLNLLQFLVRLWISPSNNFLAGIVHIFLNNNISLVNNLPSAFLNFSRYSVSGVLGSSLYYNWVGLLKRFGVAFCNRLLDKHASSSDNLIVDVNNVLISSQFSNVKNSLLEVWSNSISVFTDRSLKELGSTDVAEGAVAFFPEIKLGIRVKIVGLLSSIMAKLQTVALVLECVSFFCLVEVCLDSQAALDACVSELKMGVPNFFNCCWMEKKHIVNLVSQKNISVVWSKVKGHSGVMSNDCADVLAGISVHSSLLLPTNFCESHTLENWPHIDWVRTVAIWHPDLGMLSGLTSRASASLHFYFMKAVYGRLPVAVRKRLYNKNYPGILCLYCGEVEFSNHVFTCSKKAVSHMVLETLLSCVHDIGLYALLCKNFVLVGWFEEAVWIFENCKKTAQILTDFV